MVNVAGVANQSLNIHNIALHKLHTFLIVATVRDLDVHTNHHMWSPEFEGSFTLHVHVKKAATSFVVQYTVDGSSERPN